MHHLLFMNCIKQAKLLRSDEKFRICSKKKNQAAIRIPTKIANSLVTRNRIYSNCSLSGRYTAKVDSIFQLILWKMVYNQQNLGRQTSNKLIQLVCHYTERLLRTRFDISCGDGNLFFTILDNRKHPLEDCQVGNHRLYT